MARALDLDGAGAQIDASNPHRGRFGRAHAGEKQGVEKRIVRVMESGVVEAADFPALVSEVAENPIAFGGVERRWSGNDLLGPSDLGKREAGRNIIPARVADHGPQRPVDHVANGFFGKLALAQNGAQILEVRERKFGERDLAERVEQVAPEVIAVIARR
ncbi:MAG TPA: hypothetical protein VMV27_15480 [Candidatus Binataceae bacterium]|nr:hypothetical protein [Candidatus Binataceae bacterium]